MHTEATPHLPPFTFSSHVYRDPDVEKLARVARRLGATMQQVPSSTGIGAPGTQPAPASLARSPMSASPQGQAAAAIPFTRGSSIATAQDAIRAYTFSDGAGTSVDQIQLQTNAFLRYVVLDVNAVTAGNMAGVVFVTLAAGDAPFCAIQTLRFDDPAGQAIVAPITGFGLYVLNKYLQDTNCAFDPQLDPGYALTAGAGATGGSFSFRLVLPVEHRARDAFGALNNSAANQRYLLSINWAASTTVYAVAPTALPTITLRVTQVYWTSPPGSIVTAQGNVAVVQTPTGLGSVCFIRYERHNETAGGGTPFIQLNSVGDYQTAILFVNRGGAVATARDEVSWPDPFTWWLNDFQVHTLFLREWRRHIARAYGYTAAIDTAGGGDTGVFPLPFIQGDGLFDANHQLPNFAPANQYLATDATTKEQIRGSTWGALAAQLEVYTRLVRPVSGAALFA